MPKKVDKKEVKKKEFVIEIVDDHIQTVISLCSILEFNGLKCIQAYNGEDAIALSKKEDPDLLIVDIIMNGKSGYDVAKALSNKKIILMTGHEKDEEKIAKFKNVVGFLEKPVGAMELTQMVSKILGISDKK
jgi:DNA-binding response OmpR family regulator